MLTATGTQTGDRSFQAKTLELYDRLGRFTDLIFCPLDLPAPPRVPRQALVDWVSETRACSTTNEEQIFAKGASGSYPWNSAYAAHRGEWRNGFDSRFPEVATYLDLFPTRSWTCVNVLVQEPQQDVWLHTDPDPVLGWRVYLGHGGARVFFCPTFERLRARLSTWTEQGRRDWSKFVRTDRKLYARLPSDSCAWALNSYRAAHGVETHAGAAGERVTLLLIPDLDCLDVDAYLALLARSVGKYGDYAIWYPGAAAQCG
jgi:hypothetical protein